jgi:hypothetical protein
MTVTIYRNILNQEMKNFGKFSKKLAENLQISLVFNPHKKLCLDEMVNHDTLIFISHGSAHEIYHRFDHQTNRHQILVNRDNVKVLNDKKVIAISCGTARDLGLIACKDYGCKTYLGFFNKIHFDKKNKMPASKKYHLFVTSCYKDTFYSVLENAIKNSWTFAKLKVVLEIELKKKVTERALEINKSKPEYYKNIGIDQAILAVSNVANNIGLYGDCQEKVC